MSSKVRITKWDKNHNTTSFMKPFNMGKSRHIEIDVTDKHGNIYELNLYNDADGLRVRFTKHIIESHSQGIASNDTEFKTDDKGDYIYTRNRTGLLGLPDVQIFQHLKK